MSDEIKLTTPDGILIAAAILCSQATSKAEAIQWAMEMAGEIDGVFLNSDDEENDQ